MLHVTTYQFSMGDPWDQPPTNFGFDVCDEHEEYSVAPFLSARARDEYCTAVQRYIALEGVVLPPGYAPATVAALIVVGGASEAADEFTLDYLARLGITGRVLDDLRLLADHTIISAIS